MINGHRKSKMVQSGNNACHMSQAVADEGG